MNYRKTYTLLALIFLLFNSSISSASHIVAAEISYKSIDSFRYEVTSKIWRECTSLPIDTNDFYVQVGCDTSTNFYSLDRTLISIRKIHNPCDTLSCKPANSTGSRPGFEEHTYRSIVDLRTGNLQSLQNCCVIRFELVACCYPNSIRNGAANQHSFGYATHNRCARIKNNLAVNSGSPIVETCMNQPLYRSTQHNDQSEHDSLVYSFVQPAHVFGSPINFSSGYSINQPFDLYDPTGKGLVNPNASPPIGCYFDQIDGDITATPTSPGEYVLGVKVSEWNKDSSGSPALISTKVFNLYLSVVSCPGNFAPTIKGYSGFTVCSGDQLCFDIETEDKVKIPPPPLPSPPPDSSLISWDQSIPNATFTINDTSINQSARFCWTPDSTSIGRNTFTVTVKDNACPVQGVTVRNYEINVKPPVLAEIEYKDLGCGKLFVKANLMQSYGSSVKYHWTILDSNGNDFSEPYKPVISNAYHYLPNDTIYSRFSGKQIIRLRTTAYGYCVRDVYDTIVLNDVVSMAVPKDSTICCASLPLDLSKVERTGGKGGKWFSNDVQIDSFKLINPTDLCSINHRKFIIRYERQNGVCSATDSFKLDVIANPNVNLSDVSICLDTNYFFPEEIGLTDSTNWNYFNYKWSSPDLTVREWDSFYLAGLNRPKFKLIHGLTADPTNTHPSVQLNLQMEALSCRYEDSAIITFLSPRMIPIDDFETRSGELGLCKGGSGISLQNDNYPALWKIDGDTIHAPFYIDPINLSDGVHEITIEAGARCPVDTVEFMVKDLDDRDYLVDSVYVGSGIVQDITIQNNDVGTDTFMWQADPDFSLKSTSNTNAVVEVPINYKIPSSSPYGSVTITNKGAGICTTTSDTTLIYIEPNPCSDFSYLSPYFLEADYRDFKSYVWKLNGQLLTNFPPWRVDLLQPLQQGDSVTLITINFENKTCEQTKVFDELGVQTIESELVLYPNPVNDFLFVPGHFGAQYSIIDAQGRLIMADDLGEYIDCSHLTPGVYIIELQMDSVNIRSRFIVN